MNATFFWAALCGLIGMFMYVLAIEAVRHF